MLNVAGAYHSRLMNSAFEKLGAVLQMTPMQVPKFPVVCNVDARVVSDAAEIRSTLQDQVTGTVRWTETLEHLLDDSHCEQFIELGPGAVLAGLLNRTRKGVPIFSVTDAPSLDAAVKALAA
jgi:[acyl-carrier-protein] S-malonyltransferase